MDKIHEILQFWFGHLGSADLPTSDRTTLWFGENDTIKSQLLQFQEIFEQAITSKIDDWKSTPRGCLTLIILLDQFPRHLYRNTSKAIAYDSKALELAEEGVKNKFDQSLTLIERVFFYMPFVHSEDATIQEKSIRLYQELVTLSMEETKQIYQLFLAYAYAHFRMIKEFGRFPQYNKLLSRESTEAELAFLKNKT
ncbi:MAG: hypothetical protein A3F12_07960 [Gammaproteobacteria bacterium RIFCSPHIGHO2_12_FULL_38_14]|nr:MAG: hypothetical protein A3F12_07960 [Gammaproteobacteria bacterium RIFCSPHIGHO2_12_FULL_38_14]